MADRVVFTAFWLVDLEYPGNLVGAERSRVYKSCVMPTHECTVVFSWLLLRSSSASANLLFSLELVAFGLLAQVPQGTKSETHTLSISLPVALGQESNL